MAATEAHQQPEATGEGTPSPPAGGYVPRQPRRRHEHIVTSDEEIKEFNRGYYTKAQSQYLDPCQAQTKASMKCMEANNFEKKRCTRFFKDYSDCKKKWVSPTSASQENRSIFEHTFPDVRISKHDSLKKAASLSLSDGL